MSNITILFQHLDLVVLFSIWKGLVHVTIPTLLLHLNGPIFKKNVQTIKGLFSFTKLTIFTVKRVELSTKCLAAAF